MLNEFSQEFIFHFMLVFARLGTAFSNFPGVSSNFLFTRGRLGIALTITFVMLPMIQPYLPKISTSGADNISFLAIEILIGLVISIAAKIYFSTLNFVGQILSMQSGLGMATFYDPNQRSQIALFSNFMILVATVVIFASDTHYYYIQAVSDSYEKFPPGEILKAGDISEFVSTVFNDSFILAFKLVSPFLIISLAIMTGGGLLSRVMPNLQVFFVLSPAQIIVVMATTYVVINAIISKLVNTVLHSVNVLGF